MAYKDNETRRRRQRELRLENPEKVREQEAAAKRRYRAQDPEKHLALYREWYHNKGGKERVRTRSRRGSETWEQYVERMRQQREATLEQKRAENTSDIGRRKRCERTIYRQFRHLGFTIDLYDEMYERQNGKCKICNEERPKYGQLRMHIDHCHASSRIRGLLCPTCNAGLGSMRDNPTILRAAIAYLEEHSA